MQYLLFLCLIFFAQPAFAATQEDLADRVITGELTIDDYHRLRGSKVTEGHIRMGDFGRTEYFEKLLAENPWIRTIAEIGFNGGHSSDLFLELSPDFLVYSFDIMSHGYARIGKEFIDLRYPNRHRLIEGNSLQSVPAFSKENPDLKFDLIFIDGGHKYPVPYHDIVNMKAFAGPNTIVIIDDMQYQGVMRAWKECVGEKIITKGKLHGPKKIKWVECRYILD